MTAALALCVVRSSTLPPPELSTMADTRQQQLSVNQLISAVLRGNRLRFSFGPDSDDFLEKAEMNMFLTENRDCLNSYRTRIEKFFFPTEELLGTGYRYTHFGRNPEDLLR
jgi:hypothetical protein